jgi:hypothetical protein
VGSQTMLVKLLLPVGSQYRYKEVLVIIVLVSPFLYPQSYLCTWGLLTATLGRLIIEDAHYLIMFTVRKEPLRVGYGRLIYTRLCSLVAFFRSFATTFLGAPATTLVSSCFRPSRSFAPVPFEQGLFLAICFDSWSFFRFWSSLERPAISCLV